MRPSNDAASIRHSLGTSPNGTVIRPYSHYKQTPDSCILQIGLTILPLAAAQRCRHATGMNRNPPVVLATKDDFHPFLIYDAILFLCDHDDRHVLLTILPAFERQSKSPAPFGSA
ncbi:hypothetical protein D3C76_1202210 [compost metagenome]